MALQERNNLFRQAQFQSEMLPSFISTLMDVLMKKSHDILREETIACLFQLGQSDNFSYMSNQVSKEF